MVRDELDILSYTLVHLAAEGIDGIIVADNRSTDGTREWLENLVLPCELEVIDDPEIGYYQSRKMTHLARLAFDRGADWVIPFDADELWHDTYSELSLHDSLADCYLNVTTGYLKAELYNYFPTSSDPDDPNPFLRIQHRARHAGALPKVIVRSNPGLVIEQGNHGARGTGSYPGVNSSIQVAHFPWRSVEQFTRKVRNGHEAYEATDLPPETGAHWRGYGKLLDEKGPEAIEEIFNRWFLDPTEPIEHAPAPWGRTYKV